MISTKADNLTERLGKVKESSAKKNCNPLLRIHVPEATPSEYKHQRIQTVRGEGEERLP